LVRFRSPANAHPRIIGDRLMVVRVEYENGHVVAGMPDLTFGDIGSNIAAVPILCERLARRVVLPVGRRMFY
jgi:hypothetical protein